MFAIQMFAIQIPTVYYFWLFLPLIFFSGDEEMAFTPSDSSTRDLTALLKRMNMNRFPQLNNADDDDNEGKHIDHLDPGNTATIPLPDTQIRKHSDILVSGF